ncbi:MAG: hypothetical protein RLZZ245_2117 [Verrucomicrobiota bacterium]|jgi:hypothetical protein
MSTPDWTPAVGDGATVCHYSDRSACIVIRVSPSGKTVWMQEDTAVLDDWKPEFILGGFAGHRVNNAEQRLRIAVGSSGCVRAALADLESWLDSEGLS